MFVTLINKKYHVAAKRRFVRYSQQILILPPFSWHCRIFQLLFLPFVRVSVVAVAAAVVVVVVVVCSFIASR